jgi:SAM-dependent methyltransferase
LRTALNSLAQRIPITTKRTIIRYTRWPPVGWARLGSLRRTKPISSCWGMERGEPVDRHYIEGFLAANAADIRGRVLEIGDNTYTRRFGKDQVSQSDVLHVVEDRPQVTIIGDLTNADHIPAATFDCIIFDVAAVIRTVHRILRPGGVLLVTIPGISQISRYDMDRWGYYWSFTTRSAEELFAAVFPRDRLQVETHGNVLAAVAFLHGLASQELSRKELDYHDPDYQLLITVRAVRP